MKFIFPENFNPNTMAIRTGTQHLKVPSFFKHTCYSCIHTVLIFLLFPVIVFASYPHEYADEPHGNHLYFIENKGQWQQNILSMAEIKAGRLYVEPKKLTFLLMNVEQLDMLHHQRHHPGLDLNFSAIECHAFEINFINSIGTQIRGNCPSSAYRNYFIDNEPKNWATFVPMYREVQYQNLYNGIELRLYTQSDQAIKYDFIVAPNANADQIEVEYRGTDDIQLGPDGNLQIITSVGTLIDQKPYAYQYVNGREIQVPCVFRLQGNSLKFFFPKGYRTDLELIIDPTIVFSSFTGSLADNWGLTATYDNQRNLYAGSAVFGPGYPTTLGAFQISYSGGGSIQNFVTDIGIAKFSSSGNTLIYSTHIGGSTGSELPHSLIVDPSNNHLLILGTTSSTNYPAMTASYDNTFNGGNSLTISNIEFVNGSDIVITRLNQTGSSLVASTFLGGNNNDGFNLANNLRYNYGDEARGEVFLDASGNVFIASSTRSANFPTTSGAFQTNYGGGTQDGVLVKLNPNLSTLLYSSYIGGSSADAAYSVKIDPSGIAYVCGGTVSTNFPVTSGALYTSYRGGIVDGYIAKINPAGTAILASTYLGTNNYDQSFFVDFDDDLNVYTVGQTTGAYPIFPAGIYGVPNSGQYIHKLTNNLSSTIFSTVFGNGNGGPNISPSAFLVDICDRVYVSGWGGQVNSSVSTSTTNGLPVTSNAFQLSTDGSDFYFFVLKEDASAVEYASYFGGSGGFLTTAAEHVDGGTSRFDKEGIIYQAVCAGCGGTSAFPTTPGVWSNVNQSSNCNLGAVKFAFEPPYVLASASAAPDFVGCAPLTVNFQNSSYGATEYFWDLGTNGATSTQTNPSYTYTDTGYYTVMLIASKPGACNIADTAYLNITIIDPATFTADFTPAIDCAQLSVYVSPQVGNPAVSYNWDFGDGYISTNPNPTHFYDQPGTYTITLNIASTIPSCPVTAVATQTITLLPPVIAQAVADPVFGCIPLDVQLTNNSINATSYLWNFGNGITATTPDATITYPLPGVYTVTLTAFNPGSCNLSDQAIFNIEALDTVIVADFTYQLPGICDPQEVSFFTNYGNYVTYLWDFGDGTTSTAANPVHLYNISGNITATLVVSTPCALPDTATATFFLPPPPLVEGDILIPPQSNCAPLSVDLQAEGNAVLYLWDFGDGNTAQGTSVSHTYPNPGIYTIQLTAIDSSTCNISDITLSTVEVYTNAIADFTYSNQLAEVGQIVFFTNQSQFADSYLWNFGDGGTSTEINPIYAFEDTGFFDVCLIAMTDEGCNDTICQSIQVIPVIYIGVPNAFSPNGDSNNDFLQVEGNSGIAFMELKIFNRWGEMVYQTNDPQGRWDGTYKGEPQEMEVYVFTLVANLISGRQEFLKGNITLLR
ncbi:MAG: PKD domain-containing protein [Sphingobacteriales bacterium]|nr:MAG: PKD domain-containing protein [Sphingobacteriales bacterium]